MNKFAWNITFKDEVDTKAIKYEFLETYMEDWTINVLIFWKTEKESSIEIVEELKKAWEILDTDISIEKEDKIALLNNKVDWSIYELVSFEWIEVCYEEILERFVETTEIVSIREAWNSKKFGNKIIKADFIY